MVPAWLAKASVLPLTLHRTCPTRPLALHRTCPTARLTVFLAEAVLLDAVSKALSVFSSFFFPLASTLVSPSLARPALLSSLVLAGELPALVGLVHGSLALQLVRGSFALGRKQANHTMAVEAV